MFAILIVLIVAVLAGIAIVNLARTPQLAKAGVVLTTVSIVAAAMPCIIMTVRGARADPDEPPIKLIATLCRLNFPADCQEHLVTTSISMTEA